MTPEQVTERKVTASLRARACTYPSSDLQFSGARNTTCSSTGPGKIDLLAARSSAGEVGRARGVAEGPCGKSGPARQETEGPSARPDATRCAQAPRPSTDPAVDPTFGRRWRGPVVERCSFAAAGLHRQALESPRGRRKETHHEKAATAAPAAAEPAAAPGRSNRGLCGGVVARRVC